MTKVIKGKIYDTETATRMVNYLHPATEINEILYRTFKGAYFMLTHGYPKSAHYGPEPEPKVTALTEEEAVNWVADHWEADTVKNHFPNYPLEEA